MKFSFSEENYLKAIFHLENNFSDAVNTSSLAEVMETKASSVTDMLKKLSVKELVKYKKYKGVALSSKGERAAIEVIRKHRLWEFFLVEKLKFSWDEVHDIAEQLEHIASEKLTNELDRFLDFPQRDPHGDPIPDSNGTFRIANDVSLADVGPGNRALCIGVKDSSSEFLQYLDKKNIGLGKKIRIDEKEEYDESLLISIEGESLRISETIAKNIYVRKIEE